jgi:nitroreductase
MPTLTPLADPKQASFYEVVSTRRSVRRFTKTPISDEVLNACLDMAMLAPSSSNLQPWQFFVIESEEKRQKTVTYCMGQNAAKTANKLIVVVARTDTWRQHAKDNIKYFPVKPVPKPVQDYYGKLIPLIMTRGVMNVFTPAKWALTQATRKVRGAMVEPIYDADDLKNWALISTSLAAENLMLALRAHGFDSCPMGGFDEPQLKKLLDLNEEQHICMVIAAGERDERGIYSEQYRFERERFIVKV